MWKCSPRGFQLRYFLCHYPLTSDLLCLLTPIPCECIPLCLCTVPSMFHSHAAPHRLDCTDRLCASLTTTNNIFGPDMRSQQPFGSCAAVCSRSLEKTLPNYKPQSHCPLGRMLPFSSWSTNTSSPWQLPPWLPHPHTHPPLYTHTHTLSRKGTVVLSCRSFSILHLKNIRCSLIQYT